MEITNNHGMSLPISIWLLYDNYDHNHDDNYISATSLLKSTKQTILGSRVPSSQRSADVVEFIASRFGHAVHDSIETAWRQAGIQGMKKLGYPDHVADNIRVNPTENELAENPDIIPVWIEQRVVKEIMIDGKPWRVGGKYDMVLDNRLFDFKTTSVYAYIKKSKDDDYALQGSIYKWLSPELILSDHVHIQFIFTDWQRSEAKRSPETYPQHKALEYPVPMLEPHETETFVVGKIRELSRLWDAPQEKLPDCTDKELWRSEPSYKFYLDPEKAKAGGRSTKNFDNPADAAAFLKEKGKGIVITKPGEPKACEYCPAFPICNQGNSYFAEGN